MKRVIYIGFALFALGFTSCQKEIIEPNQASALEVLSNDSMRVGESGGFEDDDVDDGGGIVDPNGEEDGTDKPRKQSGN